MTPEEERCDDAYLVAFETIGPERLAELLEVATKAHKYKEFTITKKAADAPRNYAAGANVFESLIAANERRMR